MARAWVELPAGSGWADIQLARGRLEDDGYATETVTRPGTGVDPAGRGPA